MKNFIHQPTSRFFNVLALLAVILIASCKKDDSTSTSTNGKPKSAVLTSGTSTTNLTLTYDSEGRIIKEVASGADYENTFTYGSSGKIETMVNQNTTYTLNYLGTKLTGWVEVDSGGSATYTVKAWDSSNRPTAIYDGSRTTTLTYNIDGTCAKSEIGSIFSYTNYKSGKHNIAFLVYGFKYNILLENYEHLADVAFEYDETTYEYNSSGYVTKWSGTEGGTAWSVTYTY